MFIYMYCCINLNKALYNVRYYCYFTLSFRKSNHLIIPMNTPKKSSLHLLGFLLGATRVYPLKF